MLIIFIKQFSGNTNGSQINWEKITALLKLLEYWVYTYYCTHSTEKDVNNKSVSVSRCRVSDSHFEAESWAPKCTWFWLKRSGKENDEEEEREYAAVSNDKNFVRIVRIIRCKVTVPKRQKKSSIILGLSEKMYKFYDTRTS